MQIPGGKDVMIVVLEQEEPILVLHPTYKKRSLRIYYDLGKGAKFFGQKNSMNSRKGKSLKHVPFRKIFTIS